MEQDKRNEELKNIAPGLAKHNKESGFAVPDGYFESMTDEVIRSMGEEDTVTQLKPRRSLTARIAIAASILILITAGVFILRNEPVQNEDVFASISEDEAYAYVYSNIEEYSTDELYRAVNEEITLDEYEDLSSEDINFEVDRILEEIDPNELEELF